MYKMHVYLRTFISTICPTKFLGICVTFNKIRQNHSLLTVNADAGDMMAKMASGYRKT